MEDASMNQAQSLSNMVESFLNNIVYPNAATIPPPFVPQPSATATQVAPTFMQLPMQNLFGNILQQPPHQNIFEESFYEDTSVKRVTSPEGLQLLNDCVYDAETHKNDSCPITLEDFTHNTTNVTILPCNHAFNSVALREWLTDSHVCPICRHTLPSIEKSVAPTQPEDEGGPQTNAVNETEEISEDEASETEMETHFQPINNFITNMIQQTIDMEEQTMMQEALYNSLIENDIIDAVQNTEMNEEETNETVEIENYYGDDEYSSDSNH
jgi:hypothetical protein